MIKICIGCNKKYEAYWLRKDKQKFCSRSCCHLHTSPSGKNHYRWKGGRIINKQGYVCVIAKGHPNSSRGSNKTYALEHRFIVSNNLKRKLRDSEIIHHINGIKTDNRLENLIIMKRDEHTRHHRLKKMVSN